MTLKEKIDNALFYIEPKISLIKCEKIEDDFAIEFAEWLRNKTAQVKGNMYKLFSDFEIYNIKELLEIYKKEKGL